MIKFKEIKDPHSCLNKAKDHEPIFVLRAKDPLASIVVAYWARLSIDSGLHEVKKTTEATSLAIQMVEWRKDIK